MSETCPIVPIRDRVLVRPDPDDEQIGRIIIPNAAVELKKFVGTVVAVGEGILTTEFDHKKVPPEPLVVPLRVKVGDKVVYDKYSGTIIEWPPNSREEVVILSEANILAIVRPEEK